MKQNNTTEASTGSVDAIEFGKFIGENGYTKHQVNDRWYDSGDNYIGDTSYLYNLYNSKWAGQATPGKRGEGKDDIKIALLNQAYNFIVMAEHNQFTDEWIDVYMGLKFPATPAIDKTTAKEILKKHLGRWNYSEIEDMEDDIIEAMEEYKSNEGEVIEFAEWKDKNYLQFGQTEDYYHVNDHNKHISLTKFFKLPELYTLFISKK